MNVLGLDCLCPQSPAEDDDQSVRLVCSSDKCTLSKMTHPRCFKKLEDLGVTTLKNIKGRAREWSDKERLRVIFYNKMYRKIKTKSLKSGEKIMLILIMVIK